MRTHALLLLIVVTNAVGNVVLGYGMRQVGNIATYSPLDLVSAGVAAMRNPWVLAGVALLLVFFIAHAIVLSWADLSYVLLVTSVGYVVVAVLSWCLLGETITPLRWAGTAVIAVGVLLVGSTPVSTVAPAPSSSIARRRP